MPTADACTILRKDILVCPAPVAAEIFNSGLFCSLQVQGLSYWFASEFLHDPYIYFQSPQSVLGLLFIPEYHDN